MQEKNIQTKRLRMHSGSYIGDRLIDDSSRPKHSVCLGSFSGWPRRTLHQYYLHAVFKFGQTILITAYQNVNFHRNWCHQDTITAHQGPGSFYNKAIAQPIPYCLPTGEYFPYLPPAERMSNPHLVTPIHHVHTP